MGALQPGLPNPAMIPETWHLLIIDLKDCFFTIPVHPADSKYKFKQVRDAHAAFHQNARGLSKMFEISINDARTIVRACPDCSHHS
ncbi:POK8 protein, partial [Xiphorhynchus elegans]|nr:POK8 protein [Xiphorhynchus elegans]